MTEELKKEEKSIWRNFTDEKPERDSVIIVITKYGMHFYYYTNDDEPLKTLCGLFYVRSDQNCSGLRYSIELSDILYWCPLPEAYVS